MIFDAERDFKNCLDTAYKEGYKEGRADTAKKMKIKGFDLNLISDITGLSIDEIEQL